MPSILHPRYRSRHGRSLEAWSPTWYWPPHFPCQIGYFNADFVGYATIAHRLLERPADIRHGYWSPLYSWCMAPLIYVGMDDLTAGRLVLVAGGAIYLLAVLRGCLPISRGRPAPQPDDHRRRDDRRGSAICDVGHPFAGSRPAGGRSACIAISMRSWTPCCRKNHFAPCLAERRRPWPTWAKPTCSPSPWFICRRLC